jgi:hypothetical protein
MKLIPLIAILSLLFIAGSCNLPNPQTENTLPENFDYGKIKGNQYRQKYLSLEMTFDTTWAIQSKADIERIAKLSEAIISNDDEELKAILKATDVQIANLFAAFKYEMGTPVDYNPSIMLIAENVKQSPGIKKGSDYLFHAQKLLRRTSLDYEIDETIYQRMIDGKSFDGMKTYLNSGEITLTQEYFTFIKRDFCILFILSYVEEAEKEELYSFLDNTKL